jgi:hypothetical protein
MILSTVSESFFKEPDDKIPKVIIVKILDIRSVKN